MTDHILEDFRRALITSTSCVIAVTILFRGRYENKILHTI